MSIKRFSIWKAFISHNEFKHQKNHLTFHFIGVSHSFPKQVKYQTRLDGFDENVDDDELGDACDPDIDNDGIKNADDNCPKVSNGDQADLDKDDVGDVCDNCLKDFNPGQEDHNDNLDSVVPAGDTEVLDGPLAPEDCKKTSNPNPHWLQPKAPHKHKSQNQQDPDIMSLIAISPKIIRSTLFLLLTLYLALTPVHTSPPPGPGEVTQPGQAAPLFSRPLPGQLECLMSGHMAGQTSFTSSAT